MSGSATLLSLPRLAVTMASLVLLALALAPGLPARGRPPPPQLEELATAACVDHVHYAMTLTALHGARREDRLRGQVHFRTVQVAEHLPVAFERAQDSYRAYRGERLRQIFDEDSGLEFADLVRLDDLARDPRDLHWEDEATARAAIRMQCREPETASEPPYGVAPTTTNGAQ